VPKKSMALNNRPLIAGIDAQLITTTGETIR
jgi:hypothetical protein